MSFKDKVVIVTGKAKTHNRTPRIKLEFFDWTITAEILLENYSNTIEYL